MMTASSIPAASAAGYADYLESRTVAPERGDYYLGTDGSPAESPGRWLTNESSLRRIGIDGGQQTVPDDLRALMEGRSPSSTPDSPVWLRPAGADGSRAGGLDVTFSAPKSVSVVWGVSDPDVRQVIETAHHDAVAAAVGHLRDHVAVAGGRVDGRAAAMPARELHASEFLHTTARGVQGSVPDPQLHGHVVITSVERADGSVAAVRSRPVFQAARELGAVYRAQLATGLRDAGFTIDAAGDHDRYFRIRGVSESVERVFSKRTMEVRQAAEDFRALHGRDPERGELRDLAVRTREAKILNTRAELDGSWRTVASENGLDLTELRQHEGPTRDLESWSVRVERQVTAREAVFDERELRSVAYEQAPGVGLGLDDVVTGLQKLRDEGRLVDLENGAMTTARMRELETGLERHVVDLGAATRAPIDSRFRDHAVAQVEERIGHELTGEQLDAVHVLTGEQRAAVLIGQAGTGKGVVIDVAARAEQAAGREVHGVAVAGRTAQQLGEASPALSGRVRTLDGFVAAAERGQVRVDARTSVYVDEAGMGDTERLARLTDLVKERGASLVLIGDGRQLPSVGAGGMFERVQEGVPHAELTVVMRTPDPADQAAWSALRDGDPAAAMAHYRERGDLRFSESRAQAVDAAARRFVELAAEHGHAEVALMTDASNAEVDALNRRVQHLRSERGELRSPSVELPDSGHQVHESDRVVWTRPLPVSGGPRVENGVRGVVTGVDDRAGSVTVVLDGSERQVVLGQDQLDALRLGYASHVYRQQGATVERAIAVTGGWQTSREGAYVEASRARDGIEWHVARDELDGADDAERVDELAARMRMSRAQTPSVGYEVTSSNGDSSHGPAVAIEPIELADRSAVDVGLS